MRPILFSCVIAVVFLLPVTLFAQADSLPAKREPVKFKLGVYYNSNLNYLGRTDSLRSSGVFPMAELWIGKGFYINAAPVFLNNAISSFEYAGSVATAGYRFTNKQNKFGGNFSFTKPFYKDNSQLVQSALKAQVSSLFTWSNKIINVNAGGDVRFSGYVDYGATAGLDHIFRFEPGNGFVLVLDPSAYVYAGTQKFTRTYYKKNSFLFFPSTEQQVTESVNKFDILSYEFSMPVVLAKGKLQLIANPAYVIPQNLITIEGRPDLSERGQEMFYITLGAKVSF
ncbi:MAG TPA: hypothetical protein VF476_13750 [Chitinophagaceae bacterium]